MLKELKQKFIKFGEDELLGIKDEEGKLWLGIKKSCTDIGMSERQAKYQVEKLKEDEVLSEGVRNFVLPSNGGNQEALCLNEEYVTLFFAKIALTPAMKKENPKAVDKLKLYQLKCAKVLYQAFFETEEQKEQTFEELGLKGEIKELKTQIQNNTSELTETKNRLDTLIDNSTINSRQASRLLIHAKNRVGTMLGGAHSKEYRKNSRIYFKNLWLQLCERFETNSYKDLNPTQFNDAVTYISNWSFV